MCNCSTASLAASNGQTAEVPQLPPELAALLVDGHCHPTDTLQGQIEDAAGLAATLKATRIGTICTMSTRLEDFALVRQLVPPPPPPPPTLEVVPSSTGIIPAFGIHPWYAHSVSLESTVPNKEAHYRSLFASPLQIGEVEGKSLDEIDILLPYLPDPVTITYVLGELRGALLTYPQALLGEVGLDRAFRVPWTPGAREQLTLLAGTQTPKRALSSLQTPVAHQRAVLDAQLVLAGELRRSVSFHAVRAAGEVATVLKHWDRVRPNVVLHSCTLTPQALVQSQSKPKGQLDFGRGGQVYVSFSSGINLKTTLGQRDTQQALNQLRSQLAVAAPDRLLAETDHVDPYALYPAMMRILAVLESIEAERSPEGSTDWVNQSAKQRRAAKSRPTTLDQVFYCRLLPSYKRGSYALPFGANKPTLDDDRRTRILHVLRYNWERFCRPRPLRYDEDESSDEEG